MNKKYIIITSIITAAVVGGVVAAVLLLRPQTPANESTPQQGTSQKAPGQSGGSVSKQPSGSAQPVNPAVGRYADYVDGNTREHAYRKTILFFYAPWCGDCQAFDKVLREGPIPAGVQILKVDYDSRQDLRQKYGVTKQSTFVELDDDDDDHDHDIWVGYGQEKSINAILRNL
ncbi:thioredoxin family protein [Candidatus Saccharibacteria bacterium oral taxon 488]|nr:thioredoxin family protein [Candidatus Saccharibacteria bacterium oral taxon 488]